MKRVVIVGAGVIGMLCARELRRRGAAVTVIDKGEPGGACSRANTGWVVPSFSAPLPAPGLVSTSIKWMLRADSPIYIRPGAVPALAGWLARFWRHCNASDHAAGLEAVTRLNRRTMELFDELARDGVAFEMYESGLLCAFRTEAGLQKTLASLQSIASAGALELVRLGARELRAREPALSDAAIGGVFVEGERHVRPESLNAGLLDWLQGAGVEIRAGVEVLAVTRVGSDAISVLTSAGGVEADALVIAAGAWSGALARQLGLRLPVQAGKGYSITVTSPAIRLRGPLYFPEAKIVCSPFEDALRIGGTMELSGINERIDARRVAAIRRGAAAYLPGFDAGAGETVWVGMRPLTPDGLPVIGRAPGHDRVYLATGHAMLGVTLAPVTAVAVADLLTSGHTDIPVAPFAPGRFA